jgi:uncharacterized protein (DUF342 family)
LYKGVKILKGNVDHSVSEVAEYLFEPARIERKVPKWGEEDEKGNRSVIGEETAYEKTSLDFDEFIAATWQKGVRFGFLEEAIRSAIAKGETLRTNIAESLPVRQGTDANLQEKTDRLRRDDTPMLLSDGRMDLSRFKNRFPQVTAGTVLFEKIPRAFGIPGRDVTGSVIEALPPKDIDLHALSGVGTKVEKRKIDAIDKEVIVATADGFLHLDGKTNAVSIGEKIVNKDGVGQRTGSLELKGDVEQFGDVAGGRLLEGLDITIRKNPKNAEDGDVF